VRREGVRDGYIGGGEVHLSRYLMRGEGGVVGIDTGGGAVYLSLSGEG